MKLLLLLLVVLQIQMVFGQTRRQTIRTSDRIIKLEELADPEVIFLFDNFTPASLYYPREVINADINYRLLHDEIVTMGPDGSLLAISGRRTIDSIVVHEHNMVFIRHNRHGYVEKTGNQNVFFIKHESNYFGEEIRSGGYGDAPATAAMERVQLQALLSEAESGGKKALSLENLSGNDIRITITAKPTLVFIGNGTINSLESRRDLQRLFPDHQRDLRNFVRRNSIDFDDRDDIIKLVSFIESLENLQ